IALPTASRKVASLAVRAGAVANPSITRAATWNAPAPDSRTTASADLPGGVARAAIGSDSMGRTYTSATGRRPGASLAVSLTPGSEALMRNLFRMAMLLPALGGAACGGRPAAQTTPAERVVLADSTVV